MIIQEQERNFNFVRYERSARRQEKMLHGTKGTKGSIKEAKKLEKVNRGAKRNFIFGLPMVAEKQNAR